MNKKNDIFEMVNLMLLCIGSIIGVGFISAAEIWTFFGRFGLNFFLSILLVFVLFFVFCNKIIKTKGLQINNVKVQKYCIIKEKNTKLILKDLLLFVEVLLFSATMFSGLRNIIFELFDNYRLVLFLGFLIFVFIIINFGIGAVSKFNVITIFILLVVIVVLINDLNLGLAIESARVINKIKFNSIVSSFIFAIAYVFLNVAHLVPIFRVSEFAFSKRKRIIFSLVFSVIFCSLILLFSIFICEKSHLTNSAMPLLDYFSAAGSLFKSLFVFVLVGGVLSTLLVCLEGLKKDISKKIKSRNMTLFLTIFLPLILSILPFNFFINFVYPLIGLMNFINLIFL